MTFTESTASLSYAPTPFSLQNKCAVFMRKNWRVMIAFSATLLAIGGLAAVALAFTAVPPFIIIPVSTAIVLGVTLAVSLHFRKKFSKI